MSYLQANFVPGVETAKSALSLAGSAPLLNGTPTAAAAPKDSLAAMEAAMKLAAEREAKKKKDAEEEEAAARQPLLNDTSFDRRRVTAVYKDDGTRGHHMQVHLASFTLFIWSFCKAHIEPPLQVIIIWFCPLLEGRKPPRYGILFPLNTGFFSARTAMADQHVTFFRMPHNQPVQSLHWLSDLMKLQSVPYAEGF